MPTMLTCQCNNDCLLVVQTIFKTHDAAEFVPAMRVCTRLDTVTMLLSLHRRVQLSRDGNVSQEVSAVWSMDPVLRAAGDVVG